MSALFIFNCPLLNWFESMQDDVVLGLVLFCQLLKDVCRWCGLRRVLGRSPHYLQLNIPVGAILFSLFFLEGDRPE